MKGTDLLEAKDVKFLLGCGLNAATDLVKKMRLEAGFDKECVTHCIPGLVIPVSIFIKNYPYMKKSVNKLVEIQFDSEYERVFK